MKKLFLIFLSFVLYFNSVTASAANLGGWSLGSPVASGASAIVNGTKEIILNGASKIAKGTAKITPNAAQVAKVLRGGAAGYALSVAVEQLLGAVDWVLDPANNRVKYYKESDINLRLYYVDSYEGKKWSSVSQACNYISERLSKVTSVTYTKTSNDRYTCTILHGSGSVHTADVYIVNNPAYDPNAEKEERYLPLDVVAQQVISNAAAGDVSAQQAITAAAQDVINEAENDSAKAAPIVQQLEASKAIEAENTATGEQTQNPDKPNVTNIKLEFPAFCGWAPLVCEAAQTVISFPITLTQWWNTANQKADSWANSISQSWAEAKDWATSETKKEEDTEVELIEEPVPNVDTGIFKASGECPPDFQYPFPLPMGGTYTISYSYATVCFWFSKLYYIVVSVAWIIAFRIVTNTNTGNSDG